ncbi:hypothetical protein SLA2020_368830 [Shorea laevis]
MFHILLLCSLLFTSPHAANFCVGNTKGPATAIRLLMQKTLQKSLPKILLFQAKHLAGRETPLTSSMRQ